MVFYMDYYFCHANQSKGRICIITLLGSHHPLKQEGLAGLFIKAQTMFQAETPHG